MPRLPVCSLALALLAFPAALQAATYSCTTEFGETVPLALVREGQRQEWNAHARSLPGSSQVKQVKVSDSETLETRYLTQAGPSFRFELRCKKGAPCEGRLLPSGKVVELAPLQDLFDRRNAEATGSVTVQSTSRERFGLLVRVRKSAVPLGKEGSIPVSASGELKMFEEARDFVLDVGADEQLPLAGGSFARLAALEVKVRCRRSN